MSSYAYDSSLTSPNRTPAASVKRVYGIAREVRSITIHHWGARGQEFYSVARYLCRQGGSSSAHYVVQDGLVACLVAPDDAAWHAGNARGNATSVGLELRPEATDGDYETAAELIRELREVYGDVPLVPHSSWKATACPGVWDLARLDRTARQTPAAAERPAQPAPAPAAPEVDDDMGILLRNKVNGATIFVQGGRATTVLHPTDLAAYERAGVKRAELSPEGFAQAEKDFRIAGKADSALIAQ